MSTPFGSLAESGWVSTTRTSGSVAEIRSSSRATDAPAALATYSVGLADVRSRAA